MAETVTKDGEKPEGTPEKESTQEQTVRMADYQELQRKMSKKDKRIEELEAKAREGESVEEALKREREEKAELKRELQVSKIKGQAPKELHGLIDNFVTKYGVVPDEDDLDLLTGAIPAKPNSEEEQGTPIERSSGLHRNANAGQPKGGADLTDEEMKRIKVGDIN